jgi:hypothetical protein
MVNQILSAFVSLATIFGIGIALVSYEASQRQGRVDRAFEFYKDFRASALDADVNFLVDKWDEKSEEAAKVLKAKDQQSVEQGLERLQTSLAQEPQVKAALLRVVPFFDGLGQCVNTRLCDSDTAYALLQDRAVSVANYYGAYVSNLQHPDSPFAHGVFIMKRPPAPSRWSFLRWWKQISTSTAAPPPAE